MTLSHSVLYGTVWNYQWTLLTKDTHVRCTEVDVPSTWTQMKSGERFTKVELDANSEEYKRIEQSARATSQNSLNQIVKVFTSADNNTKLIISFV